MDLHRVDKKPDWDKVSRQHWNTWQKTAAATSGIVTVGNFFSVIGLLSIPLGLWLVLKYQAGLWAALVLALGRACDLLDGWLADKTGTKSPLGELLDATFDKLSVFVTVAALWVANLAPTWMVVALILPHIGVAIVALMAYFRRDRLHVSRLGKNSMALGWMFMLSWIATITYPNVYRTGLLGWSLTTLAMLALGASVITGMLSFGTYIRDYSNRHSAR